MSAAAAKSLQSCPTLWDPIDGSPPGSPVPGILQARTLEWVAISFSNAGKWKVKVKSLSRVRPSATPWTAAYQAPPPMGFSRQEYWSGLPLPSLSHCQGLLCLLSSRQFCKDSFSEGSKAQGQCLTDIKYMLSKYQVWLCTLLYEMPCWVLWLLMNTIHVLLSGNP